MNNALRQTGWAGPELSAGNWRILLRDHLQRLDSEGTVEDVRILLAVPIWLYSPWRTCCVSWRKLEVNYDRHFCPWLRPAHWCEVICGGADLRTYPDDMASNHPILRSLPGLDVGLSRPGLCQKNRL